MPRATVRGSDYNFVAMPEGVPEPMFPKDCRMPVVEVGWSKYPAGHVEVASGDATMIGNLMEQVSEAVAHGADGATVGEVVADFFTGLSGFWVTLDRDGCNQLIQRVRKARDDAFGKDA